MPTAPSRPCAQPACPALVTHTRYCTDHADHSRDRDRWRGTAASRGYDAAWRKVRALALKRDRYLCLNCIKGDRVTPAEDVHHVAPIRVAPERRLDLNNLMSVCRPCHSMLEPK